MASSIKRIDVEKLFGHYTYHLPSDEIAGDISRLFILYGDNGSGKTTILRLLFHLLAYEFKGGHKTFLANTPFARYSVTFDDGTCVDAMRPTDDIVGGYELAIRRPGMDKVSIRLETNSEGVITGHEDDLPPVLGVLKSLELNLILLQDDRRLRGRPDEFSNEMLFDHDRGTFIQARHVSLRHRQGDEDDIAKYLVMSSISRFESWIRSSALTGSSAGQANSDSIYTDVLKRIVNLPKGQSEGESAPLGYLRDQVQELGARVESFSKYGLVPDFHADALGSTLESAPSHTHTAAYEVLNPYIEGLSARLDALQDAQQIIDNLITSINSFFSHKTVRFDVRRGLKVQLDDGTALNPELLSSGERQLLILLCNCVTAPLKSIFVVDEPELSLNIKWQRKLADALLACTQHSNVQFLLATHSFELLAGQRDCVVPLQSKSE